MNNRELFSKFAPRVWAVWSLAQQEQQKMHDKRIGTNHLLLGILREGGGIAANVLEQLGIDLKKTCTDVEALADPVRTEAAADANAGSLSLQAGNVLVLADEEAQQLKHHYIGTEHLLLGILREEQGIAAMVLKKLDVEVDKVRPLILETIEREKQKRRPAANA